MTPDERYDRRLDDAERRHQQRMTAERNRRPVREWIAADDASLRQRDKEQRKAREQYCVEKGKGGKK